MDKKENADNILKFKREDPEQFHCLVKMHLSFLLDMNTDECDCSFLFDHIQPNDHATPKRKTSLLHNKGAVLNSSKKGIMEGAPLTMEGVCQIFQIIQFLDRSNNIEQIGLFRKTGNLQKQKVLKERLNRGVPMDLDKGEFSVHECASVLKSFLSELPEPLLTDRFFHAHCQVANTIIKYNVPKANLASDSSSDASDASMSSTSAKPDFCDTRDYDRTIESLQLLFLLIPDANYNLLKDMLKFLKRISLHQDKNKMSPSNLGTIFATHLMCPRKLSAESLQSNHQLYSSAATFMIEEADILFDVPDKVVQDVLAHGDSKLNRGKCSYDNLQPGAQCFVKSPVVNTIYSFVDRQRSKDLTNESTTDAALAELYAQAQAMPESTLKKHLITKLNLANGQGKPKNIHTLGNKNVAYNVSDKYETIKKLMTPLNCRKGSYKCISLNENAAEKTHGRSGSRLVDNKGYGMSTLEKQTILQNFKKVMKEDFFRASDITSKSDIEKDEPNTNDSVLTTISTTSSHLWKEGEMILKGEVDLSESMQLCLDGRDPSCNHEGSFENEVLSSSPVESSSNLVGSKGLKGIENYLKSNGTPLCKHSITKMSCQKKAVEDVEDSMHMSTSYAETVSALLNSPQSNLLSINKENSTTICKDIDSAGSENGCKTRRKRSLTEMIGHNPLSKERKPLGQKRCFETDL